MQSRRSVHTVRSSRRNGLLENKPPHSLPMFFSWYQTFCFEGSLNTQTDANSLKLSKSLHEEYFCPLRTFKYSPLVRIRKSSTTFIDIASFETTQQMAKRRNRRKFWKNTLAIQNLINLGGGYWPDRFPKVIR